MLFLVCSVFAEESLFDASYTCLEEQLGNNCGGTKNVEQAAFNLLAIGYDSGLQSDCRSLLNGMKNGNCWGDTDGGVCKIKPTAQVTLALNHVGEDVDNNVNWLLDKRIKDTGLVWYLEIDANNQTKCEINGKDITIQEDKKIVGADPSGLKKAYNGYWFEITDINKNFTISCDMDFITTLLYKKPVGDVYYVSSETQSASAYDSVVETVNAYCFGESSKCNYEASLWAVFALAKIEEDISSYIPYLSAMSDESSNKNYLPDAFLYTLTGADDYYSRLVNEQKQNKYWDESNNKLYDTSVALLALQGLSIDEAENAKEYLLDIRESSNCWSSHTSLILYSGWPKNPYISSGGGEGIQECQSYGYFCTSIGECNLANRVDNFICTSLSDVCCEIEPYEESCSEKGGLICAGDEECSGSEVIASDVMDCCLGDCEEIEEESYCTDVEGYVCQNSCSDEQEEKSFYYCDFGDVCCADKPKSGRSWWIIILLIVLIILVILAIIFRNQLKIWMFRGKSKFKSGSGPQSTGGRPFGPGMPPANFRRPEQVMTRRHIPQRRINPRREERDKDFEDTMKKLREISK